MNKTFDYALNTTLFWEKGYVNHRKDPGGATNYGITKKTLSRWRAKEVSAKQVKNLTKSEAEAIYKEFYWREARCYMLPPRIAIAMFDCAVNQGPIRAKKLLQSALRIKVDGIIGPKTLKAVSNVSATDLLRDFMAKRAMHYSGLKTLFTFGYGWFRRLLDVYGKALTYK